MMLPELGTGVWIGIGFGLLGIAFWVVGLFVFDRIVDKYANTDPGTDDRSLGDR